MLSISIWFSSYLKKSLLHVVFINISGLVWFGFMVWGLKVFSVEVTNVEFERFLGCQWLKARLCCRKISDSIFWLYCFTPR